MNEHPAAAARHALLSSLPTRADEDPFAVAVGGFYRRWLNLLHDLAPLMETVRHVQGTEDEDWVPLWSAVAQRFETEGEALAAEGDRANAGRAFMEAKTYYSIARFPAPYRLGAAICPPEMSPLKARAYEKYLQCFRRANELLQVAVEDVVIERSGYSARGYLRLPPGASASDPVPSVLVMCGGDMYKEDRQKYAEGALAQGLAALVVDAPGTGQTTFPHAPESVVAWQAALDVLSNRSEIRSDQLGAFGVSRGGLWVMRLAATDPRIKALISVAPAGVGYWGTAEERASWRRAADERARMNWFGPRGTRPALNGMTEEEQRKEFLRWSLKDQGLLERLSMPMYLVNGKTDHLSPIGNLYLLLESGPPTGRVARVYADDGHIAARHEVEWAPAAWRWLKEQLTAGV